MRKDRADYTVEVRRISNGEARVQYVLMGKSGEAFLTDANSLLKDLSEEFGLDGLQMVELIKLAKAGFAARYYLEEERVSAEAYY